MRFIGTTPIPETIAEMESLKDPFVTPEQIAVILGSSAESISTQAKNNPSMLGFAVVIIKTRVKIPRMAFIHFMKYGYSGQSSELLY